MKTENRFGPKGWTPERLGSLKGKTYVITGTTTGIGYEATRLLLSKGAKVVMLNRDGTRSAAIIKKFKNELGDNVDVSFIHMDLSILDSVRRAALKVKKQVPNIDALICNAAISQIARQEITIDGFESHLGVNYFGHFLLCGLLFDKIEDSKGRIVIVGSNAYKMGLKRINFEDMNFDNHYNAWNPYAHSKLALMMFAYELQRRIQAKNKNVQVYVCHPGASRTDLIKGENLNKFVKTLWAILSPFMAQSAEKGSWPLVLCATEDRLKSEAYYGPTKRSELVGPVDECVLEKHVLDRKDAAKLWTVSEQKTSFKWDL